jgi:DNA helicase-2/ATP-dependent DNA helicase PcrA
MHASKGLEFDIVIIHQANEGIVPHPKALTKDEIEEERRLFYVAETRAKEQLIITAHKTQEGKKQEVTRFLQESLE